MKKKAIPPFTLTAGQSGRLLFNFTLPDGADMPALRGALMVQGQRVDMEHTQADMLTIPSLPAGVYLAEVRAAGMCVLYGHVEVLPSPLFGEEGIATYRVDVDNTAEVLQVNIAMLEGLPGPQGDTGAPGSTAYELAVKHGYEGSEEDWVGELKGAQEAANMSKQYAGEASSSATRANESADDAANSAEAAGASAEAADTSAKAAADSAAAAANSAEAADTSAKAAADSAAAAANSAAAADTSTKAAADSAEAADTSAKAAADSAAVAEASAEAADTSAKAAADSAEAAGASAEAAAAAQVACVSVGEQVKLDFFPLVLDWLRERFGVLLGEGNFSVIHEENKLTVAVALATTAGQIDEVQQLLGRLMPQNIVTVMEWVGGMPISYTPVEYLESSGAEYLNTAVLASGDMKITLDLLVVNWGYTCYAFGSNELPEGNIMFTPDYNKAHNRAGRYTYGTQTLYFPQSTHQLDTRYLYVFDRNLVYRNGELAVFYDNASMTEEEFVSKSPMMLFAARHANGVMHPMGSKRIWKFVIESAGTRVVDFIPALDETGCPCMFDLVSGKPFYNLGTGDFLYPGQETEVTTYSLRRPQTYAQMTANGIRRLYHVPAGYNGTNEEYAAEHGYKVLVETPQPEEGYWSPVWHETEEEIVLEWVEAAAPEEEEL